MAKAAIAFAPDTTEQPTASAVLDRLLDQDQELSLSPPDDDGVLIRDAEARTPPLRGPAGTITNWVVSSRDARRARPPRSSAAAGDFRGSMASFWTGGL